MKYIILLILLSSCAPKGKLGSCRASKLSQDYILNDIYKWSGKSDCTYVVFTLSGERRVEYGVFNDQSEGQVQGNATIIINYSNIGDLTPKNIIHPVRYIIYGQRLRILKVLMDGNSELLKRAKIIVDDYYRGVTS